MKSRAAWMAVPLTLAMSLALCVGTPSEPAKAPAARAATGPATNGSARATPARDPSAIPPAVFPHDKHTADFDVKCVECHHEVNAAPLSIRHKDYFDDLWIDCGICHHKAGTPPLEPQSCSNCHPSSVRDIADETLSSKVAIHKKCWSCHDTGTGAKASAACKTCHPARSGNE